MSDLILFTSGSTKEPKEIKHSWEYINFCAQRSINEIKLTKEDVVLNVFPANVIANYTVTAVPAQIAGSTLISTNFDPYSYITLFNKYRPTYIALIPRHLDLLKNTKGFAQLDMSCVRYMVCGSSKITQEFIDTFRNQGVQLVANWYGMTEMPPPLLIGYNSTRFDLSTIPDGFKITFVDSECFVNGKPTGDIFNLDTLEFVSRKVKATNMTWKNEI